MDNFTEQPLVQVVDYDAVWKVVFQRLFRDGLTLLFPDVAGALDWTYNPKFLNVELPKIYPQTQRGMRRPDLVAEVRLREEQPALIVLNIEIQVGQDPKLPRRVFTYFYHLVERYQLPVASLVVLADITKWRPEPYRYQLLSTALQFEYGIVKLIDLDEDMLRQSKNPFALFILAHLASLRLRGDFQLLAEEKKRLFRQMLEGGYNADAIRALYQEVDHLMALPVNFEREVEAVLEEIKRRRRRKWIAPQERLAVERGLRQGLEEGMEKGLQQGLQQGITDILTLRFGDLSAEIQELINSVRDIETLRDLHRQAIQVTTLEQFVDLLRSAVENQQGQSEAES